MAVGPLKKFIFRSSKGVCGVLLNVVVAWPFCSLTDTSPASFTSTPENGSSAMMYSAISELNGFLPASPFGAGSAR